MGEDISSYLRAAFSVTLVAALIVTAIMLTTIATGMGYNFLNVATESSGTYTGYELFSISEYEYLSAPLVYKILQSNEEGIKQLSIRYLNGITTSDYNTLLFNSEKYVTVSVSRVAGGYYAVAVKEVAR